jgi:putative oxidoreductase
MRTAHLIGRLMLGGFFIYNGIHHFKKTKDMVPYAAAKGLPKPELAVKATGGMLLLGGTLLALGVKPKIGALMVAAFLAGVTPVMHNFWSISDPAQKMAETINFTKNVALLGAALALTGQEGPMPASLESALERPNKLRRIARKMAA